MRLAILLLAACAAAPTKPDWAAVDAVMRETRWRVDNCADPNSPKCDAAWTLRDELEALMAKLKDQPERCKP
jgi:hypothetical protein